MMILQTGKNCSSKILKHLYPVRKNTNKDTLLSDELKYNGRISKGASSKILGIRLTNELGLTLLETLVAVSILAICVVAIFHVFISCFEARLKAEDYGKAIGVSLDAMEYAEEFGIPLSDSEKLTEEDTCRFTWKFTQNDVDIEYYPKLKEIILDTTWEQGKHKGQFPLITYYWKPNE